MTDKELLTLAAKAAGIAHVDYSGIDYDGSAGFVLVDDHGHHTTDWNPLTNDGDALRLAAKLGLWVFCGKAHVAVDYLGTSLEQNCGNDPYAATRRAIVRAAAEIGKQMKEEGK